MMAYFKSEGSGGVDDNLLVVSPVSTDMCQETNVVKGPKTKIMYSSFIIAFLFYTVLVS